MRRLLTTLLSSSAPPCQNLEVMTRRLATLWALMVLLMSTVCPGCHAGAVTPSPALSPPKIVTIPPESFNQTVTFSVGQQFRVVPPITGALWTVDFERTIVAVLTPPDRTRNSGQDGWVFQVIGLGETDVLFSGQPGSGLAAPPAIRFVITVRGVGGIGSESTDRAGSSKSPLQVKAMGLAKDHCEGQASHEAPGV